MHDRRMKFFNKLVGRITGISTPLGGLSWDPRADASGLDSFHGRVSITSQADEGFVTFLEQNSDRLAFVDIVIDACVATSEQEACVEQESLDLDRLCTGRISGMHLPVPNGVPGTQSVKFNLIGDRLLNPSAGGTGCLFLGVTGFFEISTTHHGGPSRTFHLREVDAPIELRAKYLSRRGKR
jgi:hypothetical protein